MDDLTQTVQLNRYRLMCRAVLPDVPARGFYPTFEMETAAESVAGAIELAKTMIEEREGALVEPAIVEHIGPGERRYRVVLESRAIGSVGKYAPFIGYVEADGEAQARERLQARYRERFEFRFPLQVILDEQGTPRGDGEAQPRAA